MRKLAAIVITLIIVLFLGFMIRRIVNVKEKTDANNEKKQKMPDFSFYTLNAAKTDSKSIKGGVPIIIFYFNTDCDHCQYEARQINANISSLKDAQVIMVSFNTAPEIKRFSETYGLNKYSQVTFMQDKDYAFSQWFGSCSIPTVFIYNADHRLVKEFYGEVKLDAITKLI